MKQVYGSLQGKFFWDIEYVLNYCANHFLFLECIRMSFLASTAFRLTMLVPMMVWGYASRSNAYSTTGDSDITSKWSLNAIWLEVFTITMKFWSLQPVIIMKSKHFYIRQFTYLLLSNGFGWVTFSYTFPSLSIHDFIFDFWHSLKHSCFNALWSKPYKGWLASSEAWPSMVNTKTFSNNLYIIWGTLTFMFVLSPLDGGPVIQFLCFVWEKDDPR